MATRPIPRLLPRAVRPIQPCSSRPFSSRPAALRASPRPTSSHQVSRVSHQIYQTSHILPSSTVQPPFSLRSCRWTSSISTPQRDHLHILFCGTDDFSCVSLQALYEEMQSSPSSIASIQVLVRPAKRTGRGMKAVADSPVKELAQQLGLTVHEQDSFTGWACDSRINMVVAVSFGLFVPPRILRGCKYGGLNVHPSLLPDLHGATPIEHAILLGRASTGVTVQTLHEQTFDGGRRLMAAPQPQESTAEYVVDNTTTAKDLRDRLAPVGARLLVEVIQNGLFLPTEGDSTKPESTAVVMKGTPAPKLSKADREVRFVPSCSAAAIDRQIRALGPVWTHIVGEKKKKLVKKRVIFEEISVDEGLTVDSLLKEKEEESDEVDTLTFVQGEEEVVLPVIVDNTDVLLPLGSTEDRQEVLRLRRVKIEGYQTEGAAKALRGFIRKKPAQSTS